MQSVQDFIDWAREQKQANDWMVERWREPIRWFFVTAKAQAHSTSSVQADGSDSDGAADSARADFDGANAEICVPGGYASENDTDSERIEARSEDEVSILKVMRRRGDGQECPSYFGGGAGAISEAGRLCYFDAKDAKGEGRKGDYGCGAELFQRRDASATLARRCLGARKRLCLTRFLW